MAAYVAAWVLSFHPRRRRLAPLTPRRLLLLLLFPAFLALQLLHWACLALDLLLFPAFRRQRIERPVFVLGVPRSGTTFLHRQLAADPAFTTTSTWELFFAPSLCQRYLLRALAALDRRLGAFGARALGALVRRGGGRLDAVHAVGLDEAEEDYLALLPAAGCFFAALAFPGAAAFADLGDLERLPPGRRARLLDHYHRLLQRHVYAHGGRQLLSKNAAFASWAGALVRRFPDALVILCIREPLGALSSQLSSLQEARRLFAVDPQGDDLRRRFLDYYRRWFLALRDFARHYRPLTVQQELMARDPQGTLQRIYRELGRPPPHSDRRTGDAAPPHRHSPQQFALRREDLDASLLAAYDALRARASAA